VCASVQQRQPPTTTAVERCELSGRGREPNVPASGEGRQRLRTEATTAAAAA